MKELLKVGDIVVHASVPKGEANTHTQAMIVARRGTQVDIKTIIGSKRALSTTTSKFGIWELRKIEPEEMI